MRQLDCIVPIRVAITGTLAGEQAAVLQDSLAAAVQGRLQLARRTFAERMPHVPPPLFHPPTFQLPAGLSSEDRAALSSLIENAIASAIQGHAGLGTPGIVLAQYRPGTVAAPARPAPRRSSSQAQWAAQGAQNFQIRVRDFLSVIREFGIAGGENSQVQYEALYADLLETVRRATAISISINRPILIQTLVEQIKDRVSSVLPPEGFFVYGYTIEERLKRRLIALEQGGSTLSRLPDLSRNRLYVTPEGEPYLPAQSKLLFAFMTLPHVSLREVAVIGSEIAVPLQLRELDYLINDASFEKLFEVSWADFLQEFGDTSAILHILPFDTVRDTHQDTLRYVLNEEILSRYGSDTAIFGRLELFNSASIQSLPAAARSLVTGMVDDYVLGFSGVPPTGMWEAAWTGGYVYAALSPTEDQLNTARYAPEARANALEVIEFLTRGRAYPWSWDFLHYLSHHYQVRSRRDVGSRGTAFEFLLRELESRENGRWFGEFYDAVESSHNGDLVLFVLRLSLATAHGTNMRVVEMVRRVNANRLSYLVNTYDVDAKEILIYHEPRRRFRVNMLAIEVDSWYYLKRDLKQIKPRRMEELKAAVTAQGKLLFEKVLRGEDNTTYTEQSFGEKVLTAAATQINLNDKDLEEITITRTLRLLDVTMAIEDGVERYYITYEHVERINEEAWITVPGSRRTESDSDFEFLLWAWVYDKEAAIIVAISIGVSIFAVLVVAWEVGAIAALIDLGGGLLNIGISIAISELIYLCTAEHYTLRGFLMAALDGYLFAVGFRFGGMVGRALAQQIGTLTVRRVILGWIAERATVGIVGGASSAALTTFANGIINVATGQGEFPTFGEFVRNMALGAAMGVVFEFAGGALQPLLRSVGRTGLDTLANVVRSIREEGISLPRWGAATESALSNINHWVSSFMDQAKAEGVISAFGDRINQVTEALREVRQAAVFRRVLELAEVPINRASNAALDKILSATEGHMSDESLLGLFNRLRVSGRLGRFIDLINLLDESSVNSLAQARQLEALSNASHLQDLIGQRGAETGLRFVNDLFRGSVAEADGFLNRIGRHGDSVRTTAVDTLIRPGQRITPQALETVANKLGGLSRESLRGLDRLFASSAREAADAFLANLAADGFQRAIHFLGSLGPEFSRASTVPLTEEALQGINKLLALAGPDLGEAELANILNRTRADAGRLRRFLLVVHALPDDAVSGLARSGELGHLADANHLLQAAETRGAGSILDLVSGGFGGSAVDAEAWMARLSAEPAASQNRAIDLMLSGGRAFTPEGLLQVIQKVGAVSGDYAAALNRLYTARGAAGADALLAGATPEQLSLQAAQAVVPVAAADLATIEAKVIGIGRVGDIGIINEAARLQSTGRLGNLEDWASHTAPNLDTQMPDFVSELAAARDLAAAAPPGRVVRVGQDAATAGKSFDVTQEAPSALGPVIERRTELFTPAGPVTGAGGLLPGVAHAVDKVPAGVRAGTAPRPGGTFEGGIRIGWPPPSTAGRAGVRTFDAHGNWELRDATGVLRDTGNLGDELVNELNRPGGGLPGKEQLNAVTVYDLEGNAVIRVQNQTPGTANNWVRIP